MNKRFSTLVAAALLATSVGASAQTVTTTDLVSGKYYLLKTQTANSYLTLSGDSLSEFTGSSLTKAEREAAYWKVDYVKNADGNYSYSFTNKKTGQPLAISEGKAGFGGAISSFAWEATPTTYSATAIAHKGTQVPTGFDAVAIYKVMKLVKDVLVTASNVPTIAATDVAVRYEVVAIKTTPAAAADFNGFKAIESLTADDMKSSTLKVFIEDATKAPAVAGTLKAGTVLYAKVTYATNVTAAAAMTFQPADVDAIDLMGATDFKDEIAPATSSSFKFAYPKDVKATTSGNILESKKFSVVVVNMNVTGTSDPKEEATDATGDGEEVSLLKVDGKDEYLVVDTAVWVAEKGSFYHKITTAPLRDITALRTGVTEGTKVYSAAKGRLAANYMFNVNYDSQADSVIITPKYHVELNGMKNWNNGLDADTVLVTTGSVGTNPKYTAMQTLSTRSEAGPYYQVSVKQFSSATELTLVDAKKTAAADATPVENVYKISLSVAPSSLTVYDLASGVYFINLVSTGANKPVYNGKYKVQSLLTNDVTWAKIEAQDFKHMPAAQWVVEKAKDAKTVTIWNRETGDALHTNTIFYKDGANAYTVGGDTLTFTAFAAPADSTLGYFAQEKDAEKTYKLNYFSGLDNSKFVVVKKSGDHNIMSVDPKDGFNMFALEAEGAAAKYGVDKKDIAKVLYRQAYRIYVTPENKHIAKGDTMFVVYNETANEYRIQKDKKENATAFYLKEFNDVEGLHYYAMIDAKQHVGFKVGVKDVILNLQPEALSEVRTSAFALKEAAAPLYRRLGVTDATDKFLPAQKPDTAKIFVVSNPNRFLNENSANRIAGAGKEEGLNYLGEFNVSQFPKSTAALFIDTAYVRNDTKRPQYLLGLRPEITHSKPCTENPSHPVTGEDAINADYLVNLTDSLATQPKAKFETYTRLAFVPAKHIGDNFVVKNSKNYKAGKAATADTISFAKNAFNKAAFQFRLVKDGSADFNIESREGEFVKILNGVPVLTDMISDAETFNIAKTAEKPVANEENAINTVSVVATDGAVIINNAAGKTVMISNMLGQTIANTVITSDNATIAVPAGIAVVAVEGEKAVKAVVR